MRFIFVVLMLFSVFDSRSQSTLNNSSKYSIHFGVGYSKYFIINSVNEPFTNPVGPSVDISISKDKFIMLISAQFGNSKVNAQSIIIDTIVLNQNSDIDFRTNYLGFGYQLISFKNLLIHPYIGITWSYIKLKELDNSPEAWGVCGGINTHLILNPKNRMGNYIYLFQNTRFDIVELKNLNKGLNNFAILPEIGICFRFCANTRK